MENINVIPETIDKEFPRICIGRIGSAILTSGLGLGQMLPE